MSYEGGITEERDIKELPGRCGAAINPYRIVTADTDVDEVKASTSPTTEFPLGISGDAGENGAATYAENDPIAIRYSGVSYLKMSGTGTRHQRVMATTGGAGIAHTSQDNCWIIGVALQAWEDGQECPVLIQRQFIGEAVGS
jgi:hypothetical protein